MKSTKLCFEDLSARHAGVSQGVSSGYAEAVRVCLAGFDDVLRAADQTTVLTGEQARELLDSIDTSTLVWLARPGTH
jgi:hypothetical protein